MIVTNNINRISFLGGLIGLIFVAVALPLELCAHCPDAGWTEHESNPVIDPVARAYYPSVLYDEQLFSDHGEASAFKLWVDVDFQYYVSDDGVSWTFIGDMVDGTITGLDDPRHGHVEYYADGFAGQAEGDPTMYYRVWYWDTSLLYIVSAMRYAESPDGKSWYNDQPLTQGELEIITGVNPDWNRGTYGPVDVLYNPGATNTGTDPFDYSLVMYYDGTTGGQETIGMGYSADGIHWLGYDGDTDGKTDELLGLTGDNSDWDYNYTTYGTILRGPDGFELWYSGGNGAANHGIGYAASVDGLVWERDIGNPIFHKYDGVTWRANRTYTPSVVDVDGQLMMFFTGRDDSSNYTVGLATYYSGGCAVEGECYEDGQENPANNCQICNIKISTTAWSPNNGVSCDDGLWCNGDDTCLDRTCSQHSLTSELKCPDDGAYCNGMESCDEVSDSCVSLGSPCTEDGDFCNGNEFCDETVNACRSSGNPCVDDGEYCNGSELCDETGDQCVSLGNPCKDDGLFCTGTELCDESDDTCISSGDPCKDDGLFCTGSEFCDDAVDQCVSAGDPCGDDGAYCNGTESCDEAGDTCVSSGNPCEDDGLFCTGSEYCNGSLDQCVSTGDPCGENAICIEEDLACESTTSVQEDITVDQKTDEPITGRGCQCDSVGVNHDDHSRGLPALLLTLIPA